MYKIICHSLIQHHIVFSLCTGLSLVPITQWCSVVAKRFGCAWGQARPLSGAELPPWWYGTGVSHSASCARWHVSWGPQARCAWVWAKIKNRSLGWEVFNRLRRFIRSKCKDSLAGKWKHIYWKKQGTKQLHNWCKLKICIFPFSYQIKIWYFLFFPSVLYQKALKIQHNFSKISEEFCLLWNLEGEKST